MARIGPGISSLAAAMLAAIAAAPLALAQSDTPPLPPLVADGALSSSCAEARNAAVPLCRQWRRDYAAWEGREKAKLAAAEAPASGSGAADAPEPRPGGEARMRSCLQGDALGSSECQEWLRKIGTWYQRRLKLEEIARLEAEVARIGGEPWGSGSGATGSTNSMLADYCARYHSVTGANNWQPEACKGYRKELARLDAARHELAKLDENPRDLGLEVEAPPPPPGPAQQSCREPVFAGDPRCKAWLEEFAAWRERNEAKRRERGDEVARRAGEVSAIGERLRDGATVAEICSGRVEDKEPTDRRYRDDCIDYVEAVSRLEAAHEKLRATDPAAALIDPAPPGGSYALAGRLCLAPEILGAEDCETWSAELEAWEERQALRKEVARLTEEVDRINLQGSRESFALDYLCVSSGAYSGSAECAEYREAGKRLKKAQAALAEADKRHVATRKEIVPEAERYLVLVNANNRYFAEAARMRERVRDLYLKSDDAWSDRVASRPLARPAGTPAQKAFVELVLGMTPEQVSDHWWRLRDEEKIPPPELDDAAELVRHIARSQGAFGVVAAAEVRPLPAGVRVLFSFASAEEVGPP